MHTLRDLDIYEHYQRWLRNGKKQHVDQMIREFFVAFPDDDAQDMLWFITNIAVVSDMDELELLDRSKILYFHDCLKIVLIALKEVGGGIPKVEIE